MYSNGHMYICCHWSHCNSLIDQLIKINNMEKLINLFYRAYFKNKNLTEINIKAFTSIVLKVEKLKININTIGKNNCYNIIDNQIYEFFIYGIDETPKWFIPLIKNIGIPLWYNNDPNNYDKIKMNFNNINKGDCVMLKDGKSSKLTPEDFNTNIITFF